MKDNTVKNLRFIKPAFKFWLETDKGYVLGKGTFTLLQKIQEYGSLQEATKTLDMSYRYAWGLLRKIERNIGQPVVETQKGGRYGGGGTKLTLFAYNLLETFERLEEKLDVFLNQEWRKLSTVT